MTHLRKLINKTNEDRTKENKAKENTETVSLKQLLRQCIVDYASNKHALIKRIVIFSFIGILTFIATEVIELDGVTKWDIVCFIAGAWFLIKILPISNWHAKQSYNESDDEYSEKDDTPGNAVIFLFMIAFVVLALIAKGICLIGRFVIWPMLLLFIFDFAVLVHGFFRQSIEEPSSHSKST